MSKGEYKSRVYTDRPDYADFAPAEKKEDIRAAAKLRHEETDGECDLYVMERVEE